GGAGDSKRVGDTGFPLCRPSSLVSRTLALAAAELELDRIPNSWARSSGCGSRPPRLRRSRRSGERASASWIRGVPRGLVPGGLALASRLEVIRPSFQEAAMTVSEVGREGVRLGSRLTAVALSAPVIAGFVLLGAA